MSWDSPGLHMYLAVLAYLNLVGGRWVQPQHLLLPAKALPLQTVVSLQEPKPVSELMLASAICCFYCSWWAASCSAGAEHASTHYISGLLHIRQDSPCVRHPMRPKPASQFGLFQRPNT